MSANLVSDQPRRAAASLLDGVVAVGPVVALPTIAGLLLWNAEPWLLLWALGIATFSGLKWLTLASNPPPAGTSTLRILGYLFAWPGMNAKAFWDRETEVARPEIGEWLFAAAKLAFGLAQAGLAVPRLLPEYPYAAGATAMIGVVFVLHFGVFHLMSLAWRRAGVNAEPIMQWPILATSVSDFWGRRWNMAFRDLAFTYLLRPLAARWGTVAAMLVVFLVSGLVHEMVITLPVGGGYGGPTLYFVIQAIAMLIERSDFGRRYGLGEGITGRVFAVLVVVGPVWLLFPEPFLRLGVLPVVASLQAAIGF